MTIGIDLLQQECDNYKARCESQQRVIEELQAEIADGNVIDCFMVHEALAHAPFALRGPGSQPYAWDRWVADKLNEYLRHGVPDPYWGA